MNFIQIAGRLGAEPEARFTPNGQKVTSLRVATTHRRGGEEVTIWYNVSVWGERFDKMMSYLKKGSAVIVNGSLKPPRVYTDKSGTARASLEIDADNIQFSPFGKPQDEATSANSNAASAYTAPAAAQPYQATAPAAGSPGAAPAPTYGTPAAAPTASPFSESAPSASFQEDNLPF